MKKLRLKTICSSYKKEKKWDAVFEYPDGHTKLFHSEPGECQTLLSIKIRLADNVTSNVIQEWENIGINPTPQVL